MVARVTGHHPIVVTAGAGRLSMKPATDEIVLPISEAFFIPSQKTITIRRAVRCRMPKDRQKAAARMLKEV